MRSRLLQWALTIAVAGVLVSPLFFLPKQLADAWVLAIGAICLIAVAALQLGPLVVLIFIGVRRRRSSGWKECTGVSFDQEKLYLRGQTPEGRPFAEEIQWADLVGVCFQQMDLFASDRLFLLTAERARSYFVPTEVPGGPELIGQCVGRGLLDGLAVIGAKDGDLVYGFRRQ